MPKETMRQVDAVDRKAMGGKSMADTGSGREKEGWQPDKQPVGNLGGYNIVRVDGSAVRKNLNDQFTDWAGHSRYDFISPTEIWIDSTVHGAEEPIFVHRAIKEDLWKKQGKTDEEINELGDRFEESERKKAFGDAVGRAPLGFNPRVQEIPLRTQRLRMFVVDGEKIRNSKADSQHINFTEGGNNGPYKWVPRNEIWVEKGLQPQEMGFSALHELHERRQMLGAGKDYLSAHASASIIEHHAREHPELLQPLLKAEIAANDIT